jgi:hypothetical protein
MFRAGKALKYSSFHSLIFLMRGCEGNWSSIATFITGTEIENLPTNTQLVMGALEFWSLLQHFMAF